MKIDVKQRHIDNGVKKDCTQCMLALAVKDAGFYNVICYDFIMFTKNNKNYALKTPSHVFQKLTLWDAGETVEPFSFEINLYNVISGDK